MSYFIPKQYKKEPITVRIPYEKLEKVDELASKYEMSRSEFINQCIDYALAGAGRAACRGVIAPR